MAGRFPALATGGAGYFGSHPVPALVDGARLSTVIDDLSTSPRSSRNTG